MSKHLRRLGVILYCCALWLLFDFVYTGFIYVGPPPLRTENAKYHHGLRPNVSSEAVWGPNRYPFYTNSLAFRDARVRDVPLKSSAYRTVLIGDSFTEAAGVPFEESFAGLLSRAGDARAVKMEFLNAGVLSYSPVIYYQKIKNLLQRGLEFDELIVLPDISDIQDEATEYFCIDDDARYYAFCGETGLPKGGIFGWEWHANFMMTYQVQKFVEYTIQRWRRDRKRDLFYRWPRSAWMISEFDLGKSYEPLGVEGGIERAVRNMEKLSDLLTSRGIALTIAVYPWPMQLALDDRDSRQVKIWRDFCVSRCKTFVNTFPAFFSRKDAAEDWYEQLFIPGDFHFNAEGNRVIYEELAKYLLVDPPPRHGRVTSAPQ